MEWDAHLKRQLPHHLGFLGDGGDQSESRIVPLRGVHEGMDHILTLILRV